MNIKTKDFSILAFAKNPNNYPELKSIVGFFFVAILLSFSSCSVKKDEIRKPMSNVFSVPQMAQDSDSDGVPDAVELSRGTNPFIADVPRISIQIVKEISFGANLQSDEVKANSRVELKQVFKDVGTTKAGDLDFKTSLRKKVIKNQLSQIKNTNIAKEDVITDEDLRTSILSKWEDDNFYNVKDYLNGKDTGFSNRSGRFTTRFKIRIDNSRFVTDLNSILLKSFYYNFKSMEQEDIFNHYLLRTNGSKESFGSFDLDFFEPVTEYSLVVDGIESGTVFKNILDRKEVGLKFVDYNYISSGLKLSYTEVMSKIVSNNAKVVISDGKKTEIFFVSPGINILQVLNMINKDYELDKNGDFSKIGNLENKLNLPLDLESLQASNLGDGIWNYYGDSENTSENLKPQGLYVLSYSTVADFIANMKLDQSSEIEVKGVNQFELNDIYNEDEILLNFTLKSTDTYSEVHSQRIYEGTDTPSCKSKDLVEKKGGDYCRPVSCKQVISKIEKRNTSVTPNLNDVFREITLRDDLGNSIDFQKYKYGNNLKIIMPKKMPLLRNKIIFTISKIKNVSLREGVLSDDCTNLPNFKNVNLSETSSFDFNYKLYGIQN